MGDEDGCVGDWITWIRRRERKGWLKEWGLGGKELQNIIDK